MAERRAQAAIDRIERALARIEPFSAPRPEPESGPAAEEYERLREAHDSLRRRVIGAIGQIDELITASERG